MPEAHRIAPLNKGRWTSSHIARWCAAQQNWDKIHYDVAYATQVAKLPGTIINGALKQHLIVQFLADALAGAWVWRVDYRFAAMDLVGESLEVRGTISQTRELGGLTFVSVDFTIYNEQQQRNTTTGSAVVVHGRQPGPSPTEDGFDTPPELRLDQSVRADDATMPAHVRAKLGAQLEYVESAYPIDLSRLRLFAEAVGDLHPIHFDPECAAARARGAVFATPLFPLHALESKPGTHPLSTDPTAMGREGVNEVGRHMAGHFGYEIAWNGGNKVQVHSLARAGERVAAESVLVGAFARVGKVGGPMMFFETLNRYRTVDGRPLVTERQTMICRTEDGKGID